MNAKVIDWDGTNVPEELRQLPPGRYILDVVPDLDELTEEEDAGIRHALDQAEAGLAVPLEDALREIRSRVRR